MVDLDNRILRATINTKHHALSLNNSITYVFTYGLTEMLCIIKTGKTDCIYPIPRSYTFVKFDFVFTAERRRLPAPTTTITKSQRLIFPFKLSHKHPTTKTIFVRASQLKEQISLAHSFPSFRKTKTYSCLKR